MGFFVAALAALFSIFSVIVIGYISTSTGLGPWVELLVALLVLLLARIFCRGKRAGRGASLIGLITVAAGVAGIAATGCGFTLPTLFFLDKNVFTGWLARPVYFSGVVGGAILAAGFFSFAVTYLFGELLLADKTMPFPIGQMVARVVGAQESVKKSLELITGMATAFAYHAINFFCGFPRILRLFAGQAFSYVRFPAIAVPLDQFSIFMAIGFIAGELLLIPLLVGVATQILFVGPLHKLFFTGLSFESFLFAFGSGIVLQEAVFGFSKLPKSLRSAVISMRQRVAIGENKTSFGVFDSWRAILLVSAALVLSVAYFTYFGFSFFAQLYTLFFTLIWVYQLLLIGGKTGLAPVGRFATFVMLPGIFLFRWDAVQATLVALFVSLAGGIAVDIMFGRKMAQVADIEQREVYRAQLLGLVTSAAIMGLVFMLLINHFGLGSVELLAQKAQARAVLLSVFNFDYLALIIGVAFGMVLHFLRINTALVFTGLVFPVTQSLMLVTGGLVALLSKDKQQWEPFWSGVFAAGSLWMLIRVFM